MSEKMADFELPMPRRGMDPKQLQTLRQDYERVKRQAQARQDQLLCLEIEAMFREHPLLLSAVAHAADASGVVRMPDLTWDESQQKASLADNIVVSVKLTSLGRRAGAMMLIRAQSVLSDVALGLDPVREWAPAWLAAQEAWEIENFCESGVARSPSARM